LDPIHTINISVVSHPQESVTCDGGNNCRHYMFNQTRTAGNVMGEKAEKVMRDGDTELAEEMFEEVSGEWAPSAASADSVLDSYTA
jgi:hypothetical protein